MDTIEIMIFLIIFIMRACAFSAEIILPPSITKGPKSIQFYRTGEILTLDCEADGKPDPEYYWHHNNALLEMNMKNQENIKRPDPRNGTIVIYPATISDEGYYQCFAKNQFGKAVSDVVLLQRAVINPYPANVPERNYVGEEGSALKLECEKTKCVPSAKYSWKIARRGVDKNPVPVITNERIQIDDEGNLYFAHLKTTDHQDGKLYKCIVYNAYLDISKAGSYSVIEVIPMPTSEKRQSPLIQYATSTPAVGLVGRDIILKCLFSGYPVPTISWNRRDGKPLPLGRHNYPHKGIGIYTEMLIKDLNWDDEGEYECQAANTEGVRTATISLDIQAIPTFDNIGDYTGKLKSINATVGETVNMNCNPSGEPKLSITWFVNGNKLSDTLPERISLGNNRRTLIVRDVCRNCSGVARNTDLMVIQCNASNVHGYVFSEAYLNVLLPTVIIEGPSSTKLEYYKDVVFTCKAESDTTTLVQYKWLWNSSEVVYEEGRIQQDDDGSLHLITKGEDDGGVSFEGVYTCNATNGYSYALATASLTIHPSDKTVEPDFNGSLNEFYLVIGIGGAAVLAFFIVIICVAVACHNCNRRQPTGGNSVSDVWEPSEPELVDLQNVNPDLYEDLKNEDSGQGDGIYMTPLPDEDLTMFKRNYLTLQEMPKRKPNTLKRHKSTRELECKIKINVKNT